ncbi:hypothetical protein BCR34DRAFT_568705 [Clohesyomyces aquaticus]|uniref:DUF6594 domain-containing protein n=1 Tax=Clohesyomyces aquaticus TaxID=1231657 RepID=A0A1Y1ZGE3_9PLEO|nr:hypothetical protein BCR34DRAFT_568705 [Clohesyomyces aquaticus]
MQNAEDAMEKGEAETRDAPPVLCPTSPTLCDSLDDHKSGTTNTNNRNPTLHRRWRWSKTQVSLQKWPQKKYQTPVVTRRLNDSPKGYPNLAAFVDSDEGFAIYRRFGYIQSRLLLNKQEELRRLEVELERMDLMINYKNKNAFSTIDMSGDLAELHKSLLSDMELKFCSYANLLNASHQMLGFPKPAETDRQNVGRYIYNRKPLIQEEASWIQHKEDLITIRAGRENGWLDGVVEGILKVLHCKFIDFLFRSEDTRKKAEIDPNTVMPARPPKNEDKYEIYYTPSRIAKLTNCILTIIIITLLGLPIYLLYHMVHDVGTRNAYMSCIGTLLVFTLAFSSVLSVFTKARRHEILAAAAAYCAVLVVFLGNVGPTNTGLTSH